MEDDIKGAIERLSRAQNDIGYATLYSQEEQDRDIETVIKGYRELERKLEIKTGDVDYLQNKINKHFIDDVTLQRDYIQKSKMQREMEKLDNMMKKTINGKLQKYTPGEIIFLKRFLQELMEDK